ncbi:DUF4376 domain-containing protein [Gallibacterium genomosp. 3]|uniref:DUF4376 domain-containing protein n=1 Tax=Gallibacterium genomosp. 3 TaxID=505345 RepID=UPI0008026653|nr:DUF4376 domain-containing protein [Gallibacterium genomosp. 3]
MTVEFDKDGFALNSGYVDAFVTDTNGIYTHKATEYVVVGTGLSAGAYINAPPDSKDGFVIQRVNDKWQYIADHRGEKVYSIIDGAEIDIKEIGEYPDNTTTQPRPTEAHIWNGAEWILSDEKQAELLVNQKNEIWERIKAYRYQRSLGGVYIASVDKWFQTGEEEKTKYLGLSQVIDKIGSIEWKSFSNDFVEMTPSLLAEIFAGMVRAENADHINAERHKAAMMQSDKPLEYDYTTGWERRYED